MKNFMFLIIVLGSTSSLASNSLRSCREIYSSSTLTELSNEEVLNRMGGSVYNVYKLIGFNRGENGQLIPIFGEEFSSDRKLPEGSVGIWGGKWNARRKSVTLALEWKSYSNQSFFETPETASLPETFQRYLRAGKIPITTQNLNPVREEWSVTLVSAPSDSLYNPTPAGGRTGILLHFGVPVILKDPKSKKEFLVELKGIGSSTGGFERHDDWTIRGGEIAIQSVREHENMELMRDEFDYKNGDAVRSGGYALFKTDIAEQGLGIRITPGNIRATFGGNPSFFRTPESALKAAEAMGKRWGQYLQRGMIPMSHPENLVADAKFENFFMTDFADILPIGRLPADWGHQRREPYQTLRASVDAFLQIPMLEEVSGLKSFIAGLIPQLKRNVRFTAEFEKQLLDSKSTDEVAKVIWNSIMLPSMIEFRIKNGWVPYMLNSYEIHSAFLSKAEADQNLKKRVQSSITEMKAEIASNGQVVDNGVRAGKKIDDYFGYIYKKVQSARFLIPLFEQLKEGKIDYNQLLAIGQKMRLEDSIIGFDVINTIQQLIPEPNRIRMGIVHVMREEIKILKSVTPAMESLKESIRAAEERIAYLEALSGQDFQERYYGKTDEVVALFFLPYHSNNLVNNPYLNRQREFKMHETQIRARFFSR